MAKSCMDNIGEQGTLGVLQTMSLSDDFDDTRIYVEFKAAWQFFPSKHSESIFFKRAPIPNETVGLHIKRTEGLLVNRIGRTGMDTLDSREKQTGKIL